MIYFRSLININPKGSLYVTVGERSGKNCCWEKGNFKLTYEFKSGKTWKV